MVENAAEGVEDCKTMLHLVTMLILQVSVQGRVVPRQTQYCRCDFQNVM